MFGYLLLLFTVVPAVELVLIIQVGSHIGALNTLMLIITTGILGASLARYEGFRVLAEIQDNMNRGVIPSSQLIDGFLILVGGILLLTPGFITDTLGFLLLLPPARGLIKIWLRKKFETMVSQGRVVTFTPWGRANRNYYNNNDNNNDDYIDIDAG